MVRGAKGLAVIKQLVSKQPQDVDARLYLARIYLAERQFSESLEVLSKHLLIPALRRLFRKIKAAKALLLIIQR